MNSALYGVIRHGLMALAVLCMIGATTSASAAGRNPGPGDKPPKWYGCISAPHIEFQRQGNKVRCLYRGRQTFKPIVACVAGQTFRQDYQGTADYCVIQVGTIVKKFAPACPRGGWKLLRRAGKDICSRKAADQSWPVMF